MHTASKSARRFMACLRHPPGALTPMYTSAARSTATCTRREADARAWKAAIGLRPVEVPSGSSPERTPLRDDRPPRSRPPASPPADLGGFTPTKIRFPTQWADSAEIARAERKAYTRERNRWAASLQRQQVDVLEERLYADARQRCDCGPTALPRRPRSALAVTVSHPKSWKAIAGRDAARQPRARPRLAFGTRIP